MVRGKKVFTTQVDESAPRPDDLVRARLHGRVAQRLWVADLT